MTNLGNVANPDENDGADGGRRAMDHMECNQFAPISLSFG